MKIVRKIVLVGLMLCVLSSCSPINERVLRTDDKNSTPIPNSVEEPNSSEVFDFSSYDEFFTALYSKDSSEHKAFLEKLGRNRDRIVFYSFMENILSEKKYIPLPYLVDKPMELGSDAYWQRISLFTEEWFGLPWIWFYCQPEKETVVVSFGSFSEKIKNDGINDYIELIDLISPGFPQPGNKDSFTEYYDNIEFQSLTLNGALNVSSTVYYHKNGRVYYRFLIGDYIVSVWKYDGGEISKDYWSNFSIKNMDSIDFK